MPQSVLAATSLGPVLGTGQHTTARFLGIPYAEAPVGDLRFAAPVPTKPWTEPLDAARYGPTAQRRPFVLGEAVYAQHRGVGQRKHFPT